MNTTREWATTARTAREALVLCWRAGRWLFAGSAALQVVGAVALSVQVIGVKLLLESLLDTSNSSLLVRAAPDLVLLVGSLLLSGLATASRAALQPLLGERIGRYAVERVLTVAVDADLIAYEQPALHDRIQHALVHAVVRPLQLSTGILAMIGGLGSTVALTVSLASISPWLVLVVALAAVPGYLAASRTNVLIYEFTKQRAESDRRRNYLQSLLISRDVAKEVRGYQMERALVDQWRALTEGREAALRGITYRRLRVAVAAALAGAVITGAAVIVLLESVEHGSLSLAAAGAGALALLLLAGQLQTLASSASTFADSIRFITDLFAFVEHPEPTAFIGAQPPTAPLTALAAESVSFAYPGGPDVVRGVDLQLQPGQVVALVGRNGCGKTTLAKLLGGLLPPSSGRLTWNGASFADLDVAALRSSITPVFQDPAHLQLSVDEYLGLGRAGSDVDTPRMDAVLRRADFADAIARMPAGRATQLGPEFLGGTDLSGGQWQRLSLARALYRGGEVVILDEPASALDPLAEAQLFGHAKDLFPGQAVLIISHRFGSVRTADCIYVMDAGRVVEVGDHDSLLAQDGLYAEMFESQRSSLLGPDAYA